jgi:membrane-associated phospholipid phosphatase
LIAAGAVAASRAFDRRVFDSAQNHASSRWIKGATSAGDAIPWLALGGAGLLALDGSNPVRQRTSFAAGEAGAAAFVAASGLKYAFGRSRPASGEGNHSFHGFTSEDRHNSFPSRHAAVAWAVATPFASEYGSYWPYAAAAVTTLGRAASREHWLSDSVGGSLLGYGLGRVFWRSAQERHKDAPRLMLSTQGVVFQWDLQ